MMCTIILLMILHSWQRMGIGIITTPNTTYDYIIVGGGTAGCVMANQLSANGSVSVLLVEAGQHFSWLSTVPLLATLLQGTANDWRYCTVPQATSSFGLWNKSSAWPRGKGLGGSGAMNYLLHFPGTDEDLDAWEAAGAEGWGSAHLRPYIRRVQGGPDCLLARCPGGYGALLKRDGPRCPLDTSRDQPCKLEGGTMHVTTVDVRLSPLARAFAEAGRLLGLPFGPAQSTVRRGQRWGSLDAYLRPALHRPNLHVLLGTLVAKVEFAPRLRDDNSIAAVATGVRLQGPAGESWEVSSRRDVILSAGAVNTPQILLLSGVGPRDELSQLGVDVVADLAVGKNLHDHMNMPLYVSVEAPVSTTLDKVFTLAEVLKYIASGEGLLASSSIVGVGSAPGNLGLVLFGLGSTNEQLLRDIVNLTPDTFGAQFPFSGNRSREGFVMLASCLQPRSRGTVRVAGTDPAQPPLIDPRYLEHPADLQCMVQAVQLAAHVVASEPFRRLGARLHLPRLQRCAGPGDARYLGCAVRTAAITGHHPGGTCRVGRAGDRGVVVDPELRVVGVDGLRVVDASILPTPVSGCPNSVLVAMAERAADIITRSPLRRP
ncbi:neither inactivation nor afterpotential protein G isoform X2 [Bacillus rossius redtenbacheri]|uniref:neither inactivation nor afterpotential protein G isoform X2 n=1 Tax=Bacillus rossius redtenbacheri TaxID=93214 RepID=UPI002FDE1A52